MKKYSRQQESITQTYYDNADEYENAVGMLITPDEKSCWTADILSAAKFAADNTVLDVGCGTGVFSQLLLEWGCQVIGLDASEPMLKAAQTKLSPSFKDKVTFHLGDTHQTDLFDLQSLDWIVSRQVVCHFYDPLLAFNNWHNWLKQDGQVLIIDGLWFREGWDNEDDLIDSLPLSCLQTRATYAYLLEKSGFKIKTNTWLHHVNEYWSNTNRSKSPLYLITAQKA